MSFSCLIVDDSREFLTSATRLLRAEGVQVLGHAGNGAEASAAAESLRPDVILVDVELGDEDGVAVAAALVTGGATAVILISSRDRDSVADLLGPAGVLGFIPKDALTAEAVAALLP